MSVSEPVICTIIAKNYVAHARCLAASFKRYHPNGRMFVLLVDEAGDYIDPSAEPFEVVPVADLNIAELPTMVRRYDVRELCTAVKPFFLQHLFEKHQLAKVCYFDPDIYFYGPITAIWQALDSNQMVLTPHLLGPLDEAHVPNEWWILRGGTYNLGFIGLARDQAVDNFLAWWSVRLVTYAHCRPEQFQHFDQKWVDLAPGFLEKVTIDRYAGYNVAYWDLVNRHVTHQLGEYRVNGKPLVFWHFSGYRPEHPEQISKHQDRFTFADLPALRSLFDHYRAELVAKEYLTVVRWPFQLSSSDGPGFHYARGVSTAIGPRLYELLVRTANRLRIARLLFSVVGPRGVMLLRRLFYRSPITTRGARQPRRHGITIFGHFSHRSGVSIGTRSTLEALATQSLPVSWRAVDEISEEQPSETMQDLPSGELYTMALLDVNPDMVPQVRQRLGQKLTGADVQIGLWRWELELFREEWRDRLEGFDEIWVTSEFTRAAIAPHATVPVVAVGLPVVPGPVAPVSRRQLGIPEARSLYLTVLDLGHYPERKNVPGVIEAFRRAFGSRPGLPLLVIKTLHGDRNPRALATIRHLASSVDGLVIDRYVTRSELNALYQFSDAYISLHHAEGFGLTIAEALYFNRPVIATDYAGSTDFLSSETGFPVGYTLQKLGRTIGPYPGTAVWAEPDLDQAAHWMRFVLEEPLTAQARALQGSHIIRGKYSAEAVGKRMVSRLRRFSDQSAVSEGWQSSPAEAISSLTR